MIMPRRSQEHGLLLKKDGVYYLILNSATPIFPGLDVGAKNHTYKILKVEENLLELTCESSYENWTLWHYSYGTQGLCQTIYHLHR